MLPVNDLTVQLRRLQQVFPDHYKRLAGLAPASPDSGPLPASAETLFRSELSHSFMFDTDFYAGFLSSPDDLGEAAAGQELWHWIAVGGPRRIVPTPWFDEVFYQQAYPDIAALGLFGFVHYQQYGLMENRRPNRLFDPAWYREQTEDLPADMPPFQHYLEVGLARGIAPSRQLRQFEWPVADVTAMREACFRVDAILQRLGTRFSVAETDRLLTLFTPESYCLQAGLKPGTDGFDALAHFADEGLWAGVSCSPLFEPGFYAELLSRSDLPPRRPDEPALLHWVRHGSAAGLVPTRHFDAAFYVQRYPEVAQVSLQPFEHFLLHGAYEERRPNDWFDPDYYRRSVPAGASKLPPLLHYLIHGRSEGLAPSAVLAGLKLDARNAEQLPDLYRTIAAGLGRVRQLVPQDVVDGLPELFVPAFYIRAAGLKPTTTPAEALAHFLSDGIWHGLVPTPLFDVAIYRARLAGLEDVPKLDHQPVFLHFLTHGRSRKIMPTHRISASFYAWRYPEFDPDWLIAFDHFARYGAREGRQPVAMFDLHWCRAQLERLGSLPSELPVYLHLLIHEIDRGFLPCRGLAMLAGGERHAAFNLPLFDRLLAASEVWVGAGELRDLNFVLALFMPEAYDGAGDLPAEAGVFDRLLHFLETGLCRGDPIGPLFDADLYRQRADDVGLPDLSDMSPVLHFLRHGVASRIVPTQLFDSAAYRRFNPDLADLSDWDFRHFLFFGLYEGRRAGKAIPLPIAALPGPVGAPAVRARFIALSGAMPQGVTDQQRQQLEWAGLMQNRLRQCLASPAIAKAMTDAQVLDPLVGELSATESTLVPPFYDVLLSAHQQARRLLPRLHYDTVVCIPWIRTGGADLLAALMTAALRRVRPGERVLMLRVDNPHFDRPEWFGPDIDIVDLSGIVRALGEADAERLLYTLLVGLRPRRVININSLVCWNTFRRFGRQLRVSTRLYAYLVCWDQTRSGLRTGYPSEFYPLTAPSLDGVFTDSQYFKRELETMYVLPRALRDRLIPLYTPCRLEPARLTMAELGAASVGRRARPLILWGGRLDPQKRFDILEAVAWKLPHVDFRAWGRPTFGSGPNPARLPPNLALMGEFGSPLELPLADSDGWLFTSDWEGTPNMIIELCTLGVPIVASAVSGVPEIITPRTGWPVDPQAGVEAYVQAVEAMIAAPQARIDRAKRAQARVSARYCTASYDASLDRVLAAETVS